MLRLLIVLLLNLSLLWPLQPAMASGSYLEKVDGQVAVESPLAEALCAAGYQVSGTGLILRGRAGRA